MAIQTGQRITYGDLINGVYDKIISTCDNIGGYSSSSSLRPGHSYTRSYNNHAGDKSTGVSMTATMYGSSYLSTVSSSTVRSQLDSFFQSRGLASKAGEYITTRGMINFYANLAAFLSAKLVRVVSSYDGASAIYYYSGGYVDSIANAPNRPEIDIATTQNEIDSFVRNVSRDWQVYVTSYSYSITSS